MALKTNYLEITRTKMLERKQTLLYSTKICICLQFREKL